MRTITGKSFVTPVDQQKLNRSGAKSGVSRPANASRGVKENKKMAEYQLFDQKIRHEPFFYRLDLTTAAERVIVADLHTCFADPNVREGAVGRLSDPPGCSCREAYRRTR